MDEGKEGLLLIGTTTALLFVFLIAVLSVMLVYRRRKLIHAQEIKVISEKYQRELLQTQLEVQQETMQYIGREIHDNVGHQLTLAFLYTQQENATASMMEQVSQVINTALADLRSLSSSLIRNEQQWDDLAQLIQVECQKLQSLQLCKVHCDTQLEASATSAEVNHFLIRIVQEFTQNSLKHADCQEIRLSVRQEKQALVLQIEDDGRGFDTEASYPGMGLQNMKRRSEMIGASYVFQSTPGQGTTMTLNLPNPAV